MLAVQSISIAYVHIRSLPATHGSSWYRRVTGHDGSMGQILSVEDKNNGSPFLHTLGLRALQVHIHLARLRGTFTAISTREPFLFLATAVDAQQVGREILEPASSLTMDPWLSSCLPPCVLAPCRRWNLQGGQDGLHFQ